MKQTLKQTKMENEKENIKFLFQSITGNRNDEGFEEFLKPLGYKKVKQTLHDDIYKLQNCQ